MERVVPRDRDAVPLSLGSERVSDSACVSESSFHCQVRGVQGRPRPPRGAPRFVHIATFAAFALAFGDLRQRCE